MALRTEVEGVDLGEQVLVPAPTAHNLRGEGRRGPGVQDVCVTGKAVGLVALRFLEAGGSISGRVHRQHVVRRQDGVVVVRVALAVQWVPDGNGHAEETLAGYQPVAVQARDPVFVAGAHEGRVEGDLLATADQPFPAFLVAATVADVPLTGRHHFEGLSPFSKKFTGWVIFLGSPSSRSAALSSSTTASLAEKAVLPAMAA